jgi:hypothetical protein
MISSAAALILWPKLKPLSLKLMAMMWMIFMYRIPLEKLSGAEKAP